MECILGLLFVCFVWGSLELLLFRIMNPKDNRVTETVYFPVEVIPDWVTQERVPYTQVPEDLMATQFTAIGKHNILEYRDGDYRFWRVVIKNRGDIGISFPSLHEAHKYLIVNKDRLENNDPDLWRKNKLARNRY